MITRRCITLVATAALATAVIISVRVTPTAEGKQSGQPNQNQQEGANATKQGLTDRPKADEDKCHPKDKRTYWQRAIGPETLPNWGLLAIGIIAAIVAICTLRQIKRQVDAVFLVEKGWLNLDPPPTPALDNDIGGLSLTLTLTNVGRTPVWITHSALRCFISDENTIEEPIDYSACKPFLEAGALIGAGKTTVPCTEVAGRDMNIKIFSADRVKRQQSFFHFYGRVFYRDTTGSEKRKTFFCYRLEIGAKFQQDDFKDAWVREGPDRANRSW